MSPQPKPSGVYKKPDGKWTFDIFPSGVWKEAGEWPDEETAKEWQGKALRIWENNGGDYGSTGAITEPGPIVTR